MIRCVLPLLLTLAVAGCSEKGADLGDTYIPAIKASRGLFGSSFEISTALEGTASATLDEQGRVTSFNVTLASDPVSVLQAQAERATALAPLLRDAYEHKIRQAELFGQNVAIVGDTLARVAAAMPFGDPLFVFARGAGQALANLTSSPSLDGTEPPPLPDQPASVEVTQPAVVQPE